MAKLINQKQLEESSTEHRRRLEKLAEPRPDETKPRPPARAPNKPGDDVFVLYVEYL